VLVSLGFFLPWLEGSAEFASRDFSGFDLARLVRNFRIVASSSSEAGGAGLIAIALYAMPALAINGAAMSLVPIVRRGAQVIALSAAAAYAFAILLAALALSRLTWTDLGPVLGRPLAGFFISALGAVTLASSATLTSRFRPVTGPQGG
jgi:hypothetical protein